MLPRTNRLPASVRLKSSRTSKSTSFILKYALTEVSPSRVGIVISKKVDKRAVRRNHLRRIIMHIIQSSMPQMKTPCDMVFIFLPLGNTVSDENLRKEVVDVLKKEMLI